MGYGVAAAATALGLYVTTAQQLPAFWDTGEMQVVPWIFGIAHPTGFPAFVLLGGLFSHAVPLGTVAWRLSVFSGIATTLAAVALYIVAARATNAPLIACGSTLLFVAARTVWQDATRAEVHTLSLCFCAVAFACAYEWALCGRPRWFLGSAAGLGLGLATHLVVIWTLPGILLLALWRRRPPAPLAVRGIALFVACAIAPYAYIPIRSAQVFAAHRDPTLQLGLAAGMPFWDYAHPVVLRNFWWLVSGRQFATSTGVAAYAHPFLLARNIPAFVAFAAAQLGAAGSLLGLAGLIAASRRTPWFAASLAVFGAAGIPFALNYREEADTARYLLPALWSAALFGALGTTAAAGWIAPRWPLLRRAPAPLAGAALVCLAGIHAYRNRVVIAIDRDATARNYVAAVVRRTPSRGIVVAPWVYAPPLAYAAYVARDFGSRVLVTAPPARLWSRIAVWSKSSCVLVVNDRPLAPPGGMSLVSRSRGAPYLFSVRARGTSRCR